MNFLHSFEPSRVLIQVGPITLYWYGFFIVSGILAAILTAIRLGRKYGLDKNLIIDLAFWLTLFGILGARIYDDLLEIRYYLGHPLDSVKIWQGGLAIHGAIIAGILTIYLFSRRKKLDFWLLSAVIAPAIALGQAIGRWGNYFNQELFGSPTGLPWGIPIDLLNRPLGYVSYRYFHPTFLYESLGNLLIFFLLLGLHRRLTGENKFRKIVFYYLIAYSVLRFSTEFIRIDFAPVFLGLRVPQIASLLIIALSLLLLKNKKNHDSINNSSH